MSAAFDGSSYRRRVLGQLRARSPVDTSDPFLIADLDPAVTYTDSEVAEQLARVVAFLQRERNSAKYATLATELIRRRAEWERPLLDSASRERLRQRVLEARRDGTVERLAKVDGYLATVRDRFGGIPASRVDGLRRLAAAAGVTAAEFDARLAREKIIQDAAGAGVEPLAPEVRRQIRERLDELRTLRGGDRVTTASLWAFLDLPPDAPPERIRAAYEAMSAGNARRPHDREKTVTADLLAIVRARLIDGDPAAYTAGLMADVADHLRPTVEEHVLLDGEVTAVAYEGLIRAALAFGRGLTTEQAKSVVMGIARELGVAVSIGGVVDYVVCPECGRPEPAGGERTCRYCDAQLYTTCPYCAGLTEAAAVVCRRCGRSLRQLKAAGEAIAAVRRALADGRPREAADILGRAQMSIAAAGANAVATAETLATRVRAALGAAQMGWQALGEERAAGRADAAVERARWLVAQASDVPGPDGRTPAEVLGELTAEQAVIRRRVEAAQALPPDAQEAALVAVLATAADNRDALEALAALPLPPPSDLTATPVDGAVVLRWRPSRSVGQVSYRVERLAADPSGGLVRCSLGTTAATELSDAGAAPWRPVRYEVTAISGSRRSAPVSTEPVLPFRDVTDLRAVLTSGGVQLSWRAAGTDTVTLERTVLSSGQPPAGPEGSAEQAREQLGHAVSVRPPGAQPLSGQDAGPAGITGPRRARVTGTGFIDADIQPGVTYHYRVFIEYTNAAGQLARTPGAETECVVLADPRPVLDLTASAEGGHTVLRWTPPGDAEVRVYAAPPWGLLPGLNLGGTQAGGLPASALAAAANGAPFRPGLAAEGTVVALASITAPVRLVGASRTGYLHDTPAPGEIRYIPVTVHGERGVVGRAISCAVAESAGMPAGMPAGTATGISAGTAAGAPAAAAALPSAAAPPVAGPPASGAPAASLPASAPTPAPETGAAAVPAPAAPPASAPSTGRDPGTGQPDARAVAARAAAGGGTAAPVIPPASATGALPVPPPAMTGALAVPRMATGALPVPGTMTGALPVPAAMTGALPVPGPATGALRAPAPATGAVRPDGTAPAGQAMPPAGTAPSAGSSAGMASVVALPSGGTPQSNGALYPDGELLSGGAAQAGETALPAGAGEGPAPEPGAAEVFATGAVAVPPALPAAAQQVPADPEAPSAEDTRSGVPTGAAGSPGAGGALPGLPGPALQAAPVAVSYTVAKAGWRRRTLRVQVRNNGPVPELVLVARSGTVPPETMADGHVLSGLPPAPAAATRTIEVTLEGAQLPWGVRLLPLVGPGSPPVWVDHPADSALVIR